MRAIGCRLSAAGCDDDSHLAANQIGCQQRQSIWLPLSVTIFNRNISAFDEATLAQALLKRGQELCICICRPDAQKPNHRHCRLLRARREWPRGSSRRAAEQRDDLAPSHVEHNPPSRNRASSRNV
jgi:hypothetical protein